MHTEIIATGKGTRLNPLTKNSFYLKETQVISHQDFLVNLPEYNEIDWDTTVYYHHIIRTCKFDSNTNKIEGKLKQ